MGPARIEPRIDCGGVWAPPALATKCATSSPTSSRSGATRSTVTLLMPVLAGPPADRRDLLAPRASVLPAKAGWRRVTNGVPGAAGYSAGRPVEEIVTARHGHRPDHRLLPRSVARPRIPDPGIHATDQGLRATTQGDRPIAVRCRVRRTDPARRGCLRCRHPAAATSAQHHSAAGTSTPREALGA